ncbi:MAG: ABC transporter ATP-binding protein, partial [Myxococcales bacterium]|nr:ABC transporter ATP-binding protein [Myxococcales bacterium]
LTFDRVIVVDGGRIAEDGDPRELAARDGTLYGEMLQAEVGLDACSWQSARWRRIRVEDGRVREQAPRPPPPPRLPARTVRGAADV